MDELSNLQNEIELLKIENENLRNLFKQEILERSSIEEALRHSEALSQGILNSAMDGIVTIDSNQNITLFNQAAERMFGYKAAEVIGKPLEILMPIDKQARHRNHVQNFNETGVTTRAMNSQLDLTAQRSNGEKFPIEASISQYEQDGLKLFTAILRDVTEKRLVENELRKSKENLESKVEERNEELLILNRKLQIELNDRKIVEEKSLLLTKRLELANIASGGGVWEYDLKTDTLIWDNQMLNIYNIEKDSDNYIITRDKWLNLIHPDDRAKNTDEFSYALMAAKEYSSEFRIIISDETVKYINSHAIVVRDSNDNPIKIIGTNWDVTDQVMIYQELLKAKEMAEESDRLKSSFLANMSHEIRTPMNGILGFTQLLSDPSLSNIEIQEYLKVIQISGARLINIINDIIDISKIESGSVQVNNKNTSIYELLKNIYEFFKIEANSKGLNLVLSISDSFKQITLNLDFEKLYASVTNLVKNAIKFTHYGEIEIGLKLVENEIIIYVKDTGIGIAEDKTELIFTRFRQVSENIDRKYEGAGLGLAITKGYIELLNGNLKVESKLDSGSTFYITLPIDTLVNTPLINNENIARDNNSKKKLNIIVAEDNQIANEFLILALKNYTNKIYSAQNGKEVLDLLELHSNIDLIMMDIQMPVLNGNDTTRIIRKVNNDVVIIAQTAFGFNIDRENALNAGCNDYISKPIQIDLLHSIINKYFD